MAHRHTRTTTIWGTGSYPMGFIPVLLDALATLGSSEQLLAVGKAEFNRQTARPLVSSQSGIIDISPDPADIRNSAGFVGDNQVMELSRPYWQAPAYAMVDRFLAVHHQHELVDGQSLYFMSMSSGHTKIAEELLRYLKSRLPRHFLTIVSLVPEEANLREGIRHDPALFIRLRDQDLVETTFLPDALSPLARRFGLAHQDRALAIAFASLLAAQPHFLRQRGFADLSHGLAAYSAFTGIATASRSIVVNREVRGWKALRTPFGLPERGFAALDDVLIACQHAIQDVLTDPQCQTIAEPIDHAKLAVLALTIPLKLSDARWKPLAAAIKDQLARTHPTITTVFAAGNGTPDPRFENPYHVQASLCYPLPELPSVITEILRRPPMTRRASATPPTNGTAQLTPDLTAVSSTHSYEE